MRQRSLLLLWAGFLGLASAGIAIASFLLDRASGGLIESPWVVASAIVVLLTAAGGGLAVADKRAIAPWLLVAGLIVDLVWRLILAPARNDGFVDWPWLSFVNFGLISEIISTSFAFAYALTSVSFLFLLAAAMVGVVAFFRSATQPKTGVTSIANVGAQGGGAAASVDAGWYRDPQGLPCDRFWDGTQWTEQTRPSVGVAANVPAAGVLQMTAVPANGMGTAALTLGILGLFLFPVVFSILAIIFGSIGIGRVNNGLATNKGAATTGLVLGIIGLAVGLIIAVVLLSM